jgi:hypothetical protein
MTAPGNNYQIAVSPHAAPALITNATKKERSSSCMSSNQLVQYIQPHAYSQFMSQNGSAGAYLFASLTVANTMTPQATTTMRKMVPTSIAISLLLAASCSANAFVLTPLASRASAFSRTSSKCWMRVRASDGSKDLLRSPVLPDWDSCTKDGYCCSHHCSIYDDGGMRVKQMQKYSGSTDLAAGDGYPKEVGIERRRLFVNLAGVVAEEVSNITRIGRRHNELQREAQIRLEIVSQRDRRTCAASALRILILRLKTSGFMKTRLSVAIAIT